MSSRFPATVQLSLDEFACHGGGTGVHRDGWGIAYYEEGDVRLLKEAVPASDSALVRFIQRHPPASTMVVSHIRKATQGDHRFANCQPFVRELGGRTHVFAHNGNLARPALDDALPLGTFHPVGTTDSEYAYCALLERLRPMWQQGGVPPLDDRVAAVAEIAAALRPLGPANFVYTDGDALFVHGHRRTQRDGTIRAPGVHVLCRSCAAATGAFSTPGLDITAGGDVAQEVVLAASVPLTDEPGWTALAEGELLVIRGGEIVARRRPDAADAA
ncbi:MAG: class II glutamine amidotransferase [Myxococcales bacterium]|nr:class II glutamine amidotransferase [Myxococcales bacterium]